MYEITNHAYELFRVDLQHWMDASEYGFYWQDSIAGDSTADLDIYSDAFRLSVKDGGVDQDDKSNVFDQQVIAN